MAVVGILADFMEEATSQKGKGDGAREEREQRRCVRWHLGKGLLAGVALGAGAQSVLVLVTFKLFNPGGDIRCGENPVLGRRGGRGSRGGRPVWLGPRSAAGTPPGALSRLLQLVPGTPGLAARRASARLGRGAGLSWPGLSWPGLALAWEPSPASRAPWRFGEAERIPAAFFSETARGPLPEAWMPEGFGLSPEPSSAGA